MAKLYIYWYISQEGKTVLTLKVMITTAADDILLFFFIIIIIFLRKEVLTFQVNHLPSR